MYLGSKQSSNGYCRPDVLRRIGLACSVMNSPQRMWKCRSLSINTKVHLYQALVICVLLYGAEIWTLLAADTKALEAFHMRCQWEILDVRCWAHVSNAEVFLRFGLSTICDILRHRRLFIWPCCRPGPWSTITRSSASDGWYLWMQKANAQLKKTTRPPSQCLAQQGSAVC